MDKKSPSIFEIVRQLPVSEEVIRFRASFPSGGTGIRSEKTNLGSLSASKSEPLSVFEPEKACRGWTY